MGNSNFRWYCGDAGDARTCRLGTGLRLSLHNGVPLVPPYSARNALRSSQLLKSKIETLEKAPSEVGGVDGSCWRQLSHQ